MHFGDSKGLSDGLNLESRKEWLRADSIISGLSDWVVGACKSECCSRRGFRGVGRYINVSWSCGHDCTLCCVGVCGKWRPFIWVFSGLLDLFCC